MHKRPAEEKATTAENDRQRTVRSYVLRAGRVTEGQKRALEDLWPLYGVEPAKLPLDLESLFGNAQPVIMEIGFGNGDATWQMAKANPDRNYLGVEVHKPGVGSLLLKLEENGLDNVRIASEDAVEFLAQRIPDGALEGICLYFPDPWPKKRHHKRRIIQAPFVALMARKIRVGGLLHLATDWQPYAEFMLEVMRSEPDFENLSPAGDICPKPEWRPPTKYERRGQRLGHRVSDLVFRRIDRGE